MSPAFPARRRADEFDRLLRSTDVAAPSELRELVTLATGLSGVSGTTQPRAAFSADLRERLMAAAASELTPAAATDADRLTVHRPRTSTVAKGRRRLTAGIAALAIVGGTAGTALASQHAVPGDALYPVKRALESIHSDIAVNQKSQGDDLLADAGNRLTEVHELASRAQVGAADDTQIAQTLTTFSQQAQQASSALVKQYRSNHDQKSLTQLQSFATSSMTQLSQLAAVVPSSAKSALTTAAQTLLTIDHTVQQLCGTACGPVLQLPSSLIQSLATTVQHISETLPQSGSTTTAQGGGQPGSEPTGGPTTAPQSGGQGLQAPTPHVSTAPDNTAPSGGGASTAPKTNPSALKSAVTGLVSGAASGVGGLVNGVGGAVGGLVNGLLGSGQK